MRRLALPSLALLATLACLAIVLSRPYDGALFRGAEVASSWNQHAIRLTGLIESPASHRQGWTGWIQSLDQQYPPLLHVITIGLTPLIGLGAEGVGRAMVLWLLLVGLGAGLTTWGLTGRRGLAVAGGTATLLLPALPAASLHYYYDLPMTALLWCSIGTVLVARRVGSISLGGLGGLLFAAACLMKWSAIPQGLPFLVGALVCPLRGRSLGTAKARLLLGLAVLVVAGGLLAQFSTISTASWREMGNITLGEGQEDLGPLASLFRVFELPGVAKTGAYLFRAATALFSPGLALLALLGTWRWLSETRRGWLLFGLGALANAVFLLCLVPPVDERFLYPLAPALVLPAVLGWSTAAPRVRAAISAAWIVIALGVVWDVHHGQPNFFNQPWETDLVPNYRGRGVSLDSGDPAVGWFRADDAAQRRVFAPTREQLFDFVTSCGGETLGVTQGAVQDYADITWWLYRVLLGKLQDSGEGFVQLLEVEWDEQQGHVRDSVLPDRAGLLVLRARAEGEPPILAGGWHRVGRFALPDHPGLEVWGTPDRAACPAQARPVN